MRWILKVKDMMESLGAFHGAALSCEVNAEESSCNFFWDIQKLLYITCLCVYVFISAHIHEIEVHMYTWHFLRFSQTGKNH